METIWRSGKGRILWVIAALIAAYLFRAQLALFMTLVFGGGAVAFFLLPLAEALERSMPRPVATTLSLVIVALALIAVLALLAPPIIRQFAQLAARFDAARLRDIADMWSKRLAGLGLPVEGLTSALTAGTPPLSGFVSGASDAVAGVVQIGLSVALGVCFMNDRDALGLRLLLCVPARRRADARRVCAAILRELRGYLRGQATICGIVAGLTAIGLMLLGVPSPLALGALVGLLNVVPYFGPVLGGAPVLLVTLAQGVRPTVFAAALLLLVQQLDAMVISPRVMSGVTGLPPAAVLLALAVGGSLSGVLGMLLALPALLIVRIFLRTWTWRDTAIEKRV